MTSSEGITIRTACTALTILTALTQASGTRIFYLGFRKRLSYLSPRLPVSPRNHVEPVCAGSIQSESASHAELWPAVSTHGPYYDRYGSIANFDPEIWRLGSAEDGMSISIRFIPRTSRSFLHAGGLPDGALGPDSPKNSFYPRVGFAYKPFGDDKTVLRAGYGIYGNLIYGALGARLGGGPFSGSTTYTNAINNGVPLFSFPVSLPAHGRRVHTERIRGESGPAYAVHSAVESDDRAAMAAPRCRLSYVGSQLRNLVYARNINQPPPSTTLSQPIAGPYPIFNSISYYDNGGNQHYHGLQATIAKNYGNCLTFNAGYTWAKDLTDTQEGTFSGQTIQNQFDRRAEYGNNLLTPTHRVFGYAIYQFPFGKGRKYLDRAREFSTQSWRMADGMECYGAIRPVFYAILHGIRFVQHEHDRRTS